MAQTVIQASAVLWATTSPCLSYGFLRPSERATVPACHPRSPSMSSSRSGRRPQKRGSTCYRDGFGCTSKCRIPHGAHSKRIVSASLSVPSLQAARICHCVAQPFTAGRTRRDPADEALQGLLPAPGLSGMPNAKGPEGPESSLCIPGSQP